MDEILPTPKTPTHIASRSASLAAGAARSTPRWGIKLWPDLGLITAFWGYVALSNIVWGNSMKASLAKIGEDRVFAPWDARVGQHLLLYPFLIGILCLSRRIAWTPLWRAIPLQITCVLLFSMLANPAMDIAEGILWSESGLHLSQLTLWSDDMYPGNRTYSWMASATIFTLPFIFCMALLAGFDIYRRFRDAQAHSAALERSLNAAHLAALRQQLSPHTLFNLLHTIRGHVAWDPSLAQSMIVQLGDLLRRVLRAGEHELSQLQEELEFVRLYLELQQTRFVDRLTVATPAPDSIPQVWIPSLILQPLVENAVVHGLAHPQTTLLVTVAARLDGETLVLRVVNSLTPGFVSAGSEHPGIGLRNIRERLALQFGDSASVIAGPETPERWAAEIRLPALHHVT
jgi:Histidine kinase